MSQANVTLKRLVLGLCVCGSILSAVALAFSQDREPNSSCQTAQNLRTVALPVALDGSLDVTLNNPADIDFFRFTGIPGSLVKVDLEGQATGQGTLFDPLVGVFNGRCNLLVLDDDGSGTLNSRLVFTVPANGIFVVAATSYPDFDFLGGRGIGSYLLRLTPLLTIGSISGRAVDAVTGAPLPGDTPPFAFLELRRCQGFECSVVNAQSTDSAGRFQFTTDFNGFPLEEGLYRVFIFANAYFAGQTEPIEVAEGADRDVGDISLQPFPILLSAIQSCGDLPPEGGRCRYSVRISNNQTVPFQGAAWSIVESFDLGSFADFSRFQPALPQDITIGPGKSRVVHFAVQVPRGVRNGATICVQVFVGQGNRPFFDTVGATDFSCIVKGLTGEFLVMSEQEVKQLRQQREEQPLMPPQKKGFQKQAAQE